MPWQGSRTLEALSAFAENEPPETSAYPNPYVQAALQYLNPTPYVMWFGKGLGGYMSDNPILLLGLLVFTLLIIFSLGLLTGRSIREYQLPLLWIQFPGHNRFVRFGLTSLDPEWRIELDEKSRWKQSMYVNKEDPTKRYPIPGSIAMAPPPPPPPPSKGASKKGD